MADPRRVSSGGAYAVVSGDQRRVSTEGAYVVSASVGRRVSVGGALVAEPVCGKTPKLSVVQSGSDSVDIAVEPLPEYESVWFQSRNASGALIDEGIQTGAGNFIRTVSGLVSGQTYFFRAKVERECGWSFWSLEVEYTFIQTGTEVGCPPFPRGQLQNPDSNPPSLEGDGWFTPMPGEPLRGAATTIVLRNPDPDHTWDFEISDDQGDSYSSLATGVGSPALDGDQLYAYDHTFDTTALSDGVEYRLKATSQKDGTVYESLTFAIDNASQVEWWTGRGGDPLDGRFSKLWHQMKTGGLVFGTPGGTIWYRGLDGGIFAHSGHDWAMYADLDVPRCRGADVTIRFYIYSGEGGIFGLGGGQDTELFDAMIVFFGDGEDGDSMQGLAVGVNNFITWPLGCCDDYLTSTSAAMSAFAAPQPSGNLAPIGGVGSDVTVEGGGNLIEFFELDKMRFKAVAPPRFADTSSFPTLSWRNGASPGDNPVSSNRSCARRYEMYALRVRTEVDPLDKTRARIRTRLDGPGVEAPVGSYWHKDQWVVAPVEWPCGYVGFASRQYDDATYYPGQDGFGGRVFMSISTLPFVDDCVGEACPPCGDNPPPLVECPLCTVDPPTIELESLGATSATVRASEISPENLTHVASRWRLYLQGDLESPIVETDLLCGEQKTRTTWEDLTCETPYAATVEEFGWDEEEGVCCLSEESQPVLFELECVPGSNPPDGGGPTPPTGDCPRCVPPATAFEGCPPESTTYEGCPSPVTEYEEECV